MRNAVIFGGMAVLLTVGLFYILSQNKTSSPSSSQTEPTQAAVSPSAQNDKGMSTIQVIATNLDTPWAIAFLSDKSMLVTERQGTIRRVDSAGKLDPTPVAMIESVKEIGEGGLLGITLHPDFSSNKYIYLYYTYNSSGNDTLNRVVRMTYIDNKLTNEQIIVDQIPGAANHNGGRIKFGPDKYLYITTGDAQQPSLAQNKNSLAGKILRVTDDGKPAPGNPFNNRTFSYGHRNVQGLAWDSTGKLWATEHGPSGAESGRDEVNKIEAGKNYGWPEIQGDEKRAGMETPFVNSGNDTWAPAGAAVIDETMYFGGLRGQALYMTTFTSAPGQVQASFKNQLGRIREVVLGPDGMLYITTSNKDGRGTPNASDDKIIRVNPSKI